MGTGVKLGLSHEDKKLVSDIWEWSSEENIFTGGQSKYRIEKLHNLCSSPNIIRVNRWRKIRLAGHVAGIGEIRNAYKICRKNLKRRAIWWI
jgi:hypothetical protein